MSLETVTLNIEGMTCTNCALGVSKTIQKNGGERVNVDFTTGEAIFDVKSQSQLPEIKDAINGMGYKVKADAHDHHGHDHGESGGFDVEKKFYLTLPFTIPLLLHMFVNWAPLHNPWVQLALCLPVFILGVLHFGKSAWGSLKAGVPNMDVLIFVGSTAAFIYSLAGTLMYQGTHEVHNYLFFETASTIITLVLLGNVFEHRSVKQTTSAIRELGKLQHVKAKKITIVNGIEQMTEVHAHDVKIGDVLLIANGDRVPVDGSVFYGSALIDESMVTGESVPVEKSNNAKVIGGTILLNGSIKILAENVGKNTVIAQIIDLVKKAQQSQPQLQKLGDKVSAVFVPVVISISILTFLLAYFVFDIGLKFAIMNSIAVLVISCPCAMGLATPTAVMVGLGRAARNGILIKGGQTIEQLATIKTIVFDKTGTLTTGKFKIRSITPVGNVDIKTLENTLYTLQRYSSHPIAKSIVSELSSCAQTLVLNDILEVKGKGIQGKDASGNLFFAGSFNAVKHLTTDRSHNIYITCNDQLVAIVDMDDEIKAGTIELIAELKKNGITPVMLSGDVKERCEKVANQIGIEKIYSEKLPEEKYRIVEELTKQSPTAMVGDGINDAPALAKATVGISMGKATEVAIQQAQVVLLNDTDMKKLLQALHIGKHTVLTIKQNLFWAFFYNVVAIPVAAVGMLSPMIGALTMAFSDVIVIGNSLRLRVKKILF